MNFPFRRSFSSKSPQNGLSAVDARSRRAPSNARLRVEALERRELLSLSPTTADAAALTDAGSFVSDDNPNAAIWVTSLDDVSSTSDGKITLREAIDYAGTTVGGRKVSTTIRFKLGGTVDITKALSIGKSVSIDASDVGGVVVDRGAKSAVLLIYGGKSTATVDVSLTGLTITGGKTTTANYRGTGIQVGTYCNLTAASCVVSGNSSASGRGTGIYVDGGTLTLIDSVVSGNVGSDGASLGGGVYVENGELVATRSTFEGNAAGAGGGVYLDGGAATLDGAAFDGDKATAGNGGALYNFGGTLDVSNSSFRDDSATNAGGALYAVGGSSNSTLTDVYFGGSSAKSGGAIYNLGDALSLTNVRFENDVATDRGGAVYAGSGAETTFDVAEFNDCSASLGGAIYNLGVLALDEATFAGDAASDSGGAVYSNGFLEIRDALFESNKAAKGGAVFVAANDAGSASWVLRATFENNSATDFGGAIRNAGVLSVVDSTFVGNAATSGGGAVANEGTFFGSTLTFDGNRAEQTGGAALNGNTGTLAVADSTFVGNESTTRNGGALANYGTATVDASVFERNAASAGYGGALLNGGTLAVAYSLFAENKAVGGAGFANVLTGTVSFDGSTFWRNVATDLGGAAYIVGAATIATSYFAQNVAETAETANYYLNPDSTEKPTIDAATKFVDQTALDDYVEPTFSDRIVVADLSTGETLAAGAAVDFGAFAVLSASASETISLFNASSETVVFSDLTVKTGDATNVFAYSLARADGTAISPSESFELAPGETIFATLVADPKKLDGKRIELDWTTTPVDETGTATGAATTVRIAADATVAKTAGATTNVSSEAAVVSFDADAPGKISIALKSAPTENVVVYLQTDAGVELSTDVLVFTPTDYSTAQTVDVSLSKDALNDGDFADRITISPKIVSFESSFRGTTATRATLEVASYLAFRGDSNVDLSAAAPTGTTYWDVDGDGAFEYRTQTGTPYYIDRSAFPADSTSFSFRTTNDGRTTTGTIAVAVVDAAPTVDVETTTFAAIPGVVRVRLTASDAAISRWRLDWGDGSPFAVVEELGSAATFAHSYSANGEYALRAELLDETGAGTGVWLDLGTQTIAGVAESNAVFDELAAEDADLDFALDAFADESDFEPFGDLFD